MTAKSGVLARACRQWHFICFHCVMACRGHVLTSRFVIEGVFFSAFSPSLPLPSFSVSAKEKGFGDPRAPNLT